MRVIGIDNGFSGGVALLGVGTGPRISAMPTIGPVKQRQIDVRALRELIIGRPEDTHVYIEFAQAMPKQGASSGFNYGKSVGAVEAVVALMGFPYTIVRPRVWQTILGVPIGHTKAERRRWIKERAVQVAHRLYPGVDLTLGRRVCHDGAVDALLIAHYGRMRIGDQHGTTTEAAEGCAD